MSKPSKLPQSEISRHLQQPRVVFTVGCSGTGKTVWARSQQNPQTALLSLDDFRVMLCGSKRAYWEGSENRARSESIRAAMHDAHLFTLNSLLDRGLNVIMHNTHLSPSSFVREWQACLSRGIEPRFKLFDSDLEFLKLRNSQRPEEDRIPDDLVEAQFDAFTHRDAWWRLDRREPMRWIA